MLLLLLVLEESAREFMDRLFTKYKSPMWYLSQSICHNPTIADDVVQTVFVELTKHTGKLAAWNDKQVTGYIARAVRRETRKEMKTCAGTVDIEVVYNMPDATLSTDELVERMGDADALRRAVSQLTDEYKDILMLWYACGLSYADIAKTLGITQGAARTRKSRAIQNLKFLLSIGA